MIIFDSPEELATGFAKILSEKINSLLKENDPVNISLSGGDTPTRLFKVLATGYRDKIKWNSINFYWVDERWVPYDSPESNYGNADKYLFSKIKINSSNIHPVKFEKSPLKEAEKYSELILKNVRIENSLPSFDIILLGIGEDGHTASIFPDQLPLLTSDKIYDVAFQPVTSQRRVTMTGRTINNAKNIYFLVSGKSKAKIVSRILNKKTSIKNLPAAYIKPASGNEAWYLDSDAAGQLRSKKR